MDARIAAVMAASPVMPVIVIEDVESAVPLARALVSGGIRVLEITLRTANALEAVRRIVANVPGAIVGVGTITHADQIEAVKDAGAAFGVSPGTSAELLGGISTSGLPFLPGVMTPSDVMRVLDAGHEAMKLFPARQAGGVGMLRALGGPFAQVRFCPTGGIDATSAPEYLALANVGCVGGSWLAPPDLVKAGRWAEIEALARAARALRA
jgi:2-dehydro-3-deoxyphosphogluconate aldolase/(4S)-4-hydroxy-2-oxoglutarate aldolase